MVALKLRQLYLISDKTAQGKSLGGEEHSLAVKRKKLEMPSKRKHKIQKSKLPPGFTNLDNLPDNCLFLVYLRTLKDILKLTRLVKKLTRRFRDGRKNAFSYRFTGKETKVFCHKFMFIIQCLNHAADSPSLRLAALAFCCLQLLLLTY